MDAVSEIKNRLPIEQLVGQYVALKKSGRHFKALCPFHKERTPSFYVNSEKQLAYCFGCRRGGDHFKFVEEIEGLDFVGALKFLAEKTGVELPRIMPENKKNKSERDRIFEIHEAACGFFADQLKNTGEGKKVSAYIKKRGLNDETIQNAHIGFAPDTRNDLYKFLLGKGFLRPEILSAGLAIAKDTEQTECFDRFRMRLIFPIHNSAGKLCAFGGRAVREGDEPKYLNSPETSIYKKSSILYGFELARSEIRNSSSVIIVEGYMDALQAHQAGFKNVVACGGTALTGEQLLNLKRFTKNVIFAFDRDEAGILATERAIELGLEHEFVIKVAVWDSSAKDPDECIRNDPSKFQDAIQNAIPAFSYLTDFFSKKLNLEDMSDKRKFIDVLLPFLISIKSPLELDFWLKKISNFIDISVRSIYDEMMRYKNSQRGIKNFKSGSNASAVLPKGFQIEEYIIGIILTNPEICSQTSQLLNIDDFEDPELQNIYKIISTKYNQSLGDEKKDGETLLDFIKKTLSESELAKANLLAMFAESRVADMGWDILEKEMLESVRSMLKRRLNREKRALVKKLREAAPSEKKEILTSYQELLQREESLMERTN